MDEVNNNALEGRLSKLEVVVSHLSGSVDKLVTILEEKNKTDWGTLAAWAAVIISIGVALYWPINDKMASHSEKIQSIETQLIDIRSSRWSSEHQAQFMEQYRQDINDLRIEDKSTQEKVFDHQTNHPEYKK